ncbi:UNVERIFIED_CONTAM: AFG1-like ATPase [Sesamum radiatum]|uniref:AFG1-like ATPase n=1 Tax=Sesamum radiatum TaxID=300843 RepID=A0AAW2TSW8_SESRA
MPKKIGSSSDVDIFITVVRGFGRARMTREVIRVFNNCLMKCPRKLVRPPMLTFSSLLSVVLGAYCNDNNLVLALVMMEKCFSYGFVPDVVTLTKVIEVLCNAGRISEGVEVLERVEGNGGTLDIVAYKTLLKGFVRAGKVKAGRGFLKQMEIKGCLPNTDTYNVLIAGSGMLDSALDMFDEMKRIGVHRNFVTFETLIHGFCSTGRTRDGFQIFELMVEGTGGCAGRIGPCNSILYGLYEDNCLDQALEFLNYMRNFFPRAVGQSLRILQLCQEGGGIEEANQILDKMNEGGGFPGALVYASLIAEFSKNECTKEAVELMNKMIGHGYFPVASTFNVLINRLAEDLMMRGCLPDSESYGLIIKAFCSQGDLHQALMLFIQMVEKSIRPDYYAWNSRQGFVPRLKPDFHQENHMEASWLVYEHTRVVILEYEFLQFQSCDPILSIQYNIIYAVSSVVNFSKNPPYVSLDSHDPSLPGPLSYYKSLVNQGKLKHDPYQEKVALELDSLLGRLDQYENDMEEYHANLAKWEENRENERRRLLMEEAKSKQQGDALTSINKRRNILQKWMSRKFNNVEPGVGKWVSYLNREKKLDSLVGKRPTAPPAPKGLYIYGNVGSAHMPPVGKTMLMDMFLVPRKELFNIGEGFTFMRQVFTSTFRDTVDVFAIVALSGIVSRLLSTGTVLVATSNRAPRDLNQDGMQREIFQEFVARLEEHCEIVLIGSEIDYRRHIAESSIDQARNFESKHWKSLKAAMGQRASHLNIYVVDRLGQLTTLPLLKTTHSLHRRYSSYEYAYPRQVTTLGLSSSAFSIHLPSFVIFCCVIQSDARRFITLVDELYNHHCRLYCSAATSVDDLFQGTEEGTLFDLESFQFETETENPRLRRDVLAEGNVSSGGTTTGIISLLSGQEEMFAFRRAVSRLIEMQTPLYLEGVSYLHPYFQEKRTETLIVRHVHSSVPGGTYYKKVSVTDPKISAPTSGGKMQSLELKNNGFSSDSHLGLQLNLQDCNFYPGGGLFASLGQMGNNENGGLRLPYADLLVKYVTLPEGFKIFGMPGKERG